MSKSSDSAVAGVFALLLVAGHLCLIVEAISPVNDLILTNSQAKDFEERERIKDQVTKEVLEVLYTMFRQGTGNGASGARPTGPLRAYQGANGQALQDYSNYFAEGSIPSGFMKKSIDEKNKIRFHQCYFNPISCFK